MLFIWLFVFVIFFIAGIAAESYALGTVAGIIFLIFGLAIIVTGVQVESGENVSFTDDGWSTETTYTDVTLPFSTYSIVFGVIFVLLSMFIIYSNAEKLGD